MNEIGDARNIAVAKDTFFGTPAGIQRNPAQMMRTYLSNLMEMAEVSRKATTHGFFHVPWKREGRMEHYEADPSVHGQMKFFEVIRIQLLML